MTFPPPSEKGLLFEQLSCMGTESDGETAPHVCRAGHRKTNSYHATAGPNSELRSREYLTDTEVSRLMEAAKGNRYAHRDATMMLMAYRHGFRPTELVDLRWDQIDFDSANLAVRRAKKGSG
jgi:integrase